jgi:RNA polymerase sigma-70 factor (ECF subfamily)
MAEDFADARTSALEEEVTGLFEQLRSPLFRYLRSLGLGAQDAEEIMQEVFLALFKHLRSGKPRDSLRGWIFRVGHNQALKLRGRDERRSVQVDETFAERQLDRQPNPEQRALSNQRRRRLSAVIQALPEKDRACLALRAEGFRYREISEITGISLGAVSLSLERSLAKLCCVDKS